jgi:hypothetical protein
MAQGRGTPPKLDYSALAGAPYIAEEVTVPTPMGHALAGTLTLPKGASRTRPVGVVGATIEVDTASTEERGVQWRYHRRLRIVSPISSRTGSHA